MTKIQSRRHGYVLIDIDKDRKFLDIPKNEKVYLHFNYNAIADADGEMKKYGTSTLLMFSNPSAITASEVRILLAAGLRHQFPAITTQMAGQMMDDEKYFTVLTKIVQALTFAMEGWFEGDAAKDIQSMRVRAVAIDGTEEEEAGKKE